MPTEPPASGATAGERPAKRWLGLAAGLLVVVALAGLDAFWGAEHVIAGTVVMGPFVAALLAPARLVAVVGAVAVAATAASGTAMSTRRRMPNTSAAGPSTPGMQFLLRRGEGDAQPRLRVRKVTECRSAGVAGIECCQDQRALPLSR